MEETHICDSNSKKDTDAVKINELYEDCLNYLRSIKGYHNSGGANNGSPSSDNGITIEVKDQNDPNGDCDSQVQVYEILEERSNSFVYEEPKALYNVENEISCDPSTSDNCTSEYGTGRLRKLSAQLPKIIVTQSDPNLNAELLYKNNEERAYREFNDVRKPEKKLGKCCRSPYSEYPRRLVSKDGTENVAHISNIPFEKIRLLNDTFHTLINLRWRWIVIGTILVHFAIWFVFAVFWYITALAHYDFEPDPPKKACVTGGKDFVTIFLASIEAQTTIGFGDRTIDEECPESIFLFVTQLILGTGLSGVLTCVVYAKLTRPEKLSRDGVGFSKKAAVSIRDGKLCLMFRAWDLNYDHIIGSEFSAHFVKTHRTKEGEVIRYYTRSLELQQREFLLWPVTLVHVIDENSPLYKMTPEQFLSTSYEITVSLKGASASMGTFTQSQTSYLPREVVWGYRFPSVVSYDKRKQKYVIDHKKLNFMEQVDIPFCSGDQLSKSNQYQDGSNTMRPGSPGSFNEQLNSFHLQRSSSFKHNKK